MIDLTRRLRLNGSNPLVMYNGHKMMRSYLSGIAMNDSKDLNVDYSEQYFCIESLENINRISLIKDTDTLGVQTQPPKTFYVSRDLNTWTQYFYHDGTTKITNNWSLNAGDKLYFKCSTNRLIGFYFSSTKTYNVTGNIMSLLKGDDFAGVTELESGYYKNDNAFYCLFYHSSNLCNANNLVLPATTLSDSCYANMFNGCTSLVKAPVLVATTLAKSCYWGMFNGCTSLTEAPALPATTLYQSCYGNMFFGCTNLNYIKCLATDISAAASLSQWVIGVAATGKFTKATGVEWPSGNSGIPSGWTVIDA